MALSRAVIGEGTATSNGPTVGPFTPASGSVVFVIVVGAAAGGSLVDGLTINAGTTGLSFVQQGSNQVYGIRRAAIVFRGTAASPASGTLTLTLDVITDFAAMAYWVVEYTGHNTTTPNDTPVQASDEPGVSPLDLSDVGTVDAGDEVLVVAGHENAANSLAVTNGSAVGSDQGEATHIRSAILRVSTDDTPNITWGASSGATGGFAFIVNVAAGGRTTKNTRSWPLGVNIGMGWRMPA